MTVQFSRCFAMPNAETFSIKPIGEFVQRYLGKVDGFCVSTCASVDPFARNRNWCSWNNDIDPSTSAESHKDAEDFVRGLAANGHKVALAIFDPPYSPRQISECYKGFGREVTAADTQNASLYKRVRDALDVIVEPGGIVLSFGWQSVGMGINRGYELIETMLVAHGGAHNDTICIAERKSLSIPQHHQSGEPQP
jgi:hypothetical protein